MYINIRSMICLQATVKTVQCISLHPREPSCRRWRRLGCLAMWRKQWSSAGGGDDQYRLSDVMVQTARQPGWGESDAGSEAYWPAECLYSGDVWRTRATVKHKRWASDDPGGPSAGWREVLVCGCLQETTGDTPGGQRYVCMMTLWYGYS